MIKISKPFDGRQCNCCYSTDSVMDITIRSNQNNQGNCVALCTDCRQELIKKLQAIKPDGYDYYIPYVPGTSKDIEFCLNLCSNTSCARHESHAPDELPYSAMWLDCRREKRKENRRKC